MASMAVSKRSKCMGQKCASARYDPTSSRVIWEEEGDGGCIQPSLLPALLLPPTSTCYGTEAGKLSIKGTKSID